MIWLPNRRRSIRRETPKDLAAAGSAELSDILRDCGCAGTILTAGSITDCSAFPKTRANYCFTASIRVFDGATTISGGTLAWVSDCRWESDEFEVECGSYAADTYVWVLEVATGCCSSRLYLERTSGSGCSELTLEFVNPFPFLPLGSTLFVLSEYSEDVDASTVCDLCVGPCYDSCSDLGPLPDELTIETPGNCYENLYGNGFAGCGTKFTVVRGGCPCLWLFACGTAVNPLGGSCGGIYARVTYGSLLDEVANPLAGCESVLSVCGTPPTIGDPQWAVTIINDNFDLGTPCGCIAATGGAGQSPVDGPVSLTGSSDCLDGQITIRA